MNELEKTATQSLSDIAARVAGAMEAVVNEHGESAVELGLLAYRVDAIKSLIMPMICIVTLIWVAMNARKAWVFLGTLDEYEPSAPRFFGFLVAALPTSIMVAVALEAFDPVLWMAAFGRPELLIATRALSAAGLL